jgi:urease accessory protein
MSRVYRAPPRLAAAALIELMRLASPALPVGGFSYSEALESAVDAGLVTDLHQAREWLLDQLHLNLARSDLPVVASAFNAWRRGDVERARELNQWVTMTRETRELAQQSQQMGRSLVEWMRQRELHDPLLEPAAAFSPAPTWPLAYALAASRTGAPQREALIAFAVGWAESMVQAAIKAVPLGQSAGRRLLDALGEEIPRAVDAAIVMPDSQRQAFAPMLAILSSLHETQYSRLFRS